MKLGQIFAILNKALEWLSKEEIKKFLADLEKGMDQLGEGKTIEEKRAAARAIGRIVRTLGR